MPTPHERYLVIDRRGLVPDASRATLTAAKRVAALTPLAEYPVAVYDRMARHGQPCTWNLRPDGTWVVTEHKEAQP